MPKANVSSPTLKKCHLETNVGVGHAERKACMSITTIRTVDSKQMIGHLRPIPNSKAALTILT
jgi:hypothetical protein